MSGVEIPPSGTRGGRTAPAGAPGRLIMRALRFVHRRTGNKMGGAPLVYLTTVGAKSGERRTSAVMGFPDGEDAVLIVASRAGAAGHPGWLYNLAKHPDQVEIEFQGRKAKATPRTLAGEERAQAWKRISAEQSRFAGYEQQTDREIPVVRLSLH